MKLQERIDLLAKLGNELNQMGESWQVLRDRAFRDNAWFVPEFTEHALAELARHMLQPEILQQAAERYQLPDTISDTALVGVTMAGNIPAVGFHDWLCIFLSGHRQKVKLSSKDSALMTGIFEWMYGQDNRTRGYFEKADNLKGCDAYIATGSNNTARYFEYYFARFPHIIRRNRTSAAILTGNESPEQLNRLADDILLYFGLGCRNVSKLYVPEGYDFAPLLEALKRYEWMKDHHKFRNNYDYQLSLLILNNRYYMTNDVVLLVEDASLFSPISQVHYEYADTATAKARLEQLPGELQCVIGDGGMAFGEAQQPSLFDYADGVDTLSFLRELRGS